MSIVGKVYKCQKLFIVWETKLLSAHASKNKNKFEYILSGTKMICLGYELMGSPEKTVTKLLIDGVIWYTYLDPITHTIHFEEL